MTESLKFKEWTEKREYGPLPDHYTQMWEGITEHEISLRKGWTYPGGYVIEDVTTWPATAPARSEGLYYVLMGNEEYIGSDFKEAERYLWLYITDFDEEK